MGAVAPGQAQVMHHGEDGPPRLFQPLPDQGEDLLLVVQVQMVGRFVQDQHLRVLGKHLGQEDTLHLPAGERQHTGMPKRCETCDLQRFFHFVPSPVVTTGKQAGFPGITAQADHFLHRIGITHMVLLGQDTDPLRQFGSFQRFEIPAFPPDGSRTGDSLRDRFDQGGLTGTVRAGQHQPFPFVQMKGKRIDGHKAIVPNRDAVSFKYADCLRHADHLAFLVR